MGTIRTDPNRNNMHLNVNTHANSLIPRPKSAPLKPFTFVHNSDNTKSQTHFTKHKLSHRTDPSLSSSLPLSLRSSRHRTSAQARRPLRTRTAAPRRSLDLPYHGLTASRPLPQSPSPPSRLSRPLPQSPSPSSRHPQSATHIVAGAKPQKGPSPSSFNHHRRPPRHRIRLAESAKTPSSPSPAATALRRLQKGNIAIMVQWHRHLLPIVRHITRSASPSLPQGQLQCLRTWTARTTLLPSFSSRSPIYHSFQYQGISSSTWLANSSEPDQTPVSSPLAQLSLPAGREAQGQEQKDVAKKEKVQAVLKGIKQSPKKINLVAALVRGMLVKDALLQLQVTVKRASKTVFQVIHSARANASHNHGLDPERLIVAEAFVGKGNFQKRVSYHSKGRSGIKIRPECRLTVVVREITAEEEAEIARLKVHNFRKLTKRERRLVPHQLIESNPVWGRKSKSSSQNLNAAAA